MNTIIVYELFDGRYHTNPDRATIYEVCDTLKEARKTAPEYGDDTVIVKSTIKQVSGNSYKTIKIKSEVVQ